MTKYFSDKELACKLTGKYILADGFGERLDELRERWGKPIILTSAARSKAHNAAVGGHPRSLHVYDEPFHPTGGCCAVDIKMPDSEEKWQLIKLAMNLRFTIGAASNFVHIDDRQRILGMGKTFYTYSK